MDKWDYDELFCNNDVKDVKVVREDLKNNLSINEKTNDWEDKSQQKVVKPYKDNSRRFFKITVLVAVSAILLSACVNSSNEQANDQSNVQSNEAAKTQVSSIELDYFKDVYTETLQSTNSLNKVIKIFDNNIYYIFEQINPDSKRYVDKLYNYSFNTNTINLIADKYIYGFIPYKDMIVTSYDGIIYKISKNGATPESIVEGVKSGFCLIDEYIYYCTVNGINRTSLDTGESEVVIYFEGKEDVFRNAWFYKDKIYYKDLEKLWEYDCTSGNKNLMVNKEVQQLIFNGDQIFYTDEGRLTKLDRSTKQETELVEFDDNTIKYIQIHDDFIYFSLKNGSYGGSLYRININGSELTRYNYHCFKGFEIYENYMYFCDDFKLYRVELNSTEAEVLVIGLDGELVIHNDYIYILDDNMYGDSLLKVSLDGTNIEEINDKAQKKLYVEDGTRISVKNELNENEARYIAKQLNGSIYKTPANAILNVYTDVNSDTKFISIRIFYELSDGEYDYAKDLAIEIGDTLSSVVKLSFENNSVNNLIDVATDKESVYEGITVYYYSSISSEEANAISAAIIDSGFDIGRYFCTVFKIDRSDQLNTLVDTNLLYYDMPSGGVDDYIIRKHNKLDERVFEVMIPHNYSESDYETATALADEISEILDGKIHIRFLNGYTINSKNW